MHLNMSSAKWRPFYQGEISYRQASTSPVTTKAVTLTTFPSLCKGCHSLYCRLCLSLISTNLGIRGHSQWYNNFSRKMSLYDAVRHHLAVKLSDTNLFRRYQRFGSLHHIHVCTLYIGPNKAFYDCISSVEDCSISLLTYDAQKSILHYWPFQGEIHRPLVDLMFSLLLVWTNSAHGRSL